jgi:cell division protease FtsH
MTLDRVHKISIVPRGQALGYVMNLPDEDSYLKTREELIDQLTVLLGGRVAEQLIFGGVTTGAANDLQRVSEITHAMVHDYGMGSQTAAPRAVRESEAVSDLTRRIRDEEQQELAFEAHRHAHELINEHRATLEEFAQQLLQNEVLERPQIDKIMDGVPRIDRRPAQHSLRVAAASKQPPPKQD